MARPSAGAEVQRGGLRRDFMRTKRAGEKLQKPKESRHPTCVKASSRVRKPDDRQPSGHLQLALTRVRGRTRLRREGGNKSRATPPERRSERARSRAADIANSR